MAEKQLTPAERKKYEDLKKKDPAKAKAYRDGIIKDNKTSATPSPAVQGTTDRQLNTKQRQEYERLKKEYPGSGKAEDYKKGIIAQTGGKPDGVDSNPITIGGDSTTGGTNTGGNTTTPSTPTDGTTATPTFPGTAGQTTQQTINAGMNFGDEFANRYISPDTFGLLKEPTSPEMQDLLNMLDRQRQEAFQYSQLENEAIAQQRAGLAGYAAPEVQAMREAAQQEINRQYKTQMAGQLAQAQRFGVRGGGLMAMQQDNSMMRGQAQGNLERDLVIKNAEEIQNRRNAFSSLIRQTEDARFGRGNQATELYTGVSTGEEAGRRAREGFNVGQRTAYDTTRSGLALSGAGLATGVFTEQQAIEQAQRQIDAAMAEAAKTRESSERIARLGLRSQEKIYGQSSNSGGAW